jgi:hypothetical protein
MCETEWKLLTVSPVRITNKCLGISNAIVFYCTVGLLLVTSTPCRFIRKQMGALFILRSLFISDNRI